jgi:hypothetical protein
VAVHSITGSNPVHPKRRRDLNGFFWLAVNASDLSFGLQVTDGMNGSPLVALDLLKSQGIVGV